jgi:hypothetical protein
MMKTKLTSLLLLVFLLPSPAQAWWDTGHMAVATVAYQRLTPETQKWVDELIPVLTQFYPRTRNFIESAAWPDDIKRDRVYLHAPMHYTNIPYNPDNVALPTNAQPEVDVVYGINSMATILRSRKANDLEKSRALAFLVHFVGDIHQPLHTTSMYTNEQPGGNRGGNDFPLTDSLHSNLHKLWDDGCGYFDAWKSRISREPWSDATFAALSEIADSVTRVWPENRFPNVANPDAEDWAREGHKLAVKYGYKGVQSVNEGGWKTYLKHRDVPTEHYLKNGQMIVEKQIALAGYRLARMLNSIHDELDNN